MNASSLLVVSMRWPVSIAKQQQQQQLQLRLRKVNLLATIYYAQATEFDLRVSRRCARARAWPLDVLWPRCIECVRVRVFALLVLLSASSSSLLWFDLDALQKLQPQ